MARTNNLTNYLTDIANTIKEREYENTEIFSLLSEMNIKIQASGFDTEIQEKLRPQYNGVPTDVNKNPLVSYFIYNDMLDTIDFNNSYVECGKNDAEQLFFGCEGLTSIDGLSSDNFGTSQCISFRQMFEGCSGLTSLDVSFLTENAKIMEFMFSGCTGLTSITLDIDTSNVISFIGMFASDYMLENIYGIENFDVSSAISFYNMFGGCDSLTSLDLSSWQPSNLIDMRYMFGGCFSLSFLDIRNFEISNLDTYYTDSAFSGVDSSCEIIVKDDTEKGWFESNYPELENVKTVAEYEA